MDSKHGADSAGNAADASGGPRPGPLIKTTTIVSSCDEDSDPEAVAVEPLKDGQKEKKKTGAKKVGLPKVKMTTLSVRNNSVKDAANNDRFHSAIDRACSTLRSTFNIELSQVDYISLKDNSTTEMGDVYYADVLLVHGGAPDESLPPSVTSCISRRQNGISRLGAKSVTAFFYSKTLPTNMDSLLYGHRVSYAWKSAASARRGSTTMQPGVNGEHDDGKRGTPGSAPDAPDYNGGNSVFASAAPKGAATASAPRHTMRPEKWIRANMETNSAEEVNESLSGLLESFMEDSAQSGVRFARDLEFRERLEDAKKEPDEVHQERLDALAEAFRKSQAEIVNVQLLLHTFLLQYRDLKQYQAMINLAGDLSRGQNFDDLLPGIRQLVAFAYNRDKQTEKALELCESIIESRREASSDASGRHSLKEAYGLLGRIHKESYINSVENQTPDGYRDHAERAIAAYREVDKLESQDKEEISMYGACNLVTLLFCQHHTHGTATATEVDALCDKIGRAMLQKASRDKGTPAGNIEDLTDYWDAATYFEAQVVRYYTHAGQRKNKQLAIEYLRLANDAANRMQKLTGVAWKLETTSKNISLIRRLGESEASPAPEYKEFRFWVNYLELAGQSKPRTEAERWPALERPSEPHANRYNIVYVSLHRTSDAQPAKLKIEDLLQRQHLSTTRDASLEEIKGVESTFYPQNIDKTDNPRRAIKIIILREGHAEDLLLVFPSEKHSEAFKATLGSLGWTRPEKVQVHTEQTLKWRFDGSKDKRNVLGEGTFAKVYLGWLQRGDSEIPMAIKEYKTSTISSNLPEKELKALMHLQNSNIVSYYGSENDPRGAYRIFLEYVPGGSLTGMLEKWGPLNTCLPYLAFYAKQLLEAVKCLHVHDHVHRDIKGDNLLVNQFSGCIKLTDFNTCKLQTELLAARVSVAGTKPFMAPEVRDQRGEAEFSKEADIWSVGCTIWQMAMGRVPPAAGIDATTCKEGIEDVTLQEFIAKCLHETPSERPKASDLLEDRFLEKNSTLPVSPARATPSSRDASSASAAASTRPLFATGNRALSRSRPGAFGFSPLDLMDADNEAYIDLSSIRNLLLDLFSAESGALILDSWEKVVPSLHSVVSQLTGWKKALPKLLAFVQAQLAVTNQPETEADAAPTLQKKLHRACNDFVKSWLQLGHEVSPTDAAEAQQVDPDAMHSSPAQLLVMAKETISRIREDDNVMRTIAQAACKHNAAPHWIFILELELAEAYKQVTSSLADSFSTWQRRHQFGRDLSDINSEIDTASVSSSRLLADTTQNGAPSRAAPVAKKAKTDKVNNVAAVSLPENYQNIPAWQKELAEQAHHYAQGDDDMLVNLCQHNTALMRIMTANMLETCENLSRAVENRVAARQQLQHPPVAAMSCTDKTLLSFLRGIDHLSPENVHRVGDCLASHDITYPILISSIKENDLQQTGLSIGLRATLWKAVEAARRAMDE